MNPIYQSLLAVLAISLISLIGVFTLSLQTARLKKILIFLVSFSAGALIGDTFIHLLPEINDQFGFSTQISLYIILGIILFFILEKFLHWHHCHHPESCSDHPKNLATINLVGDAFHNFIDGAVIAGSFLAGPVIGFSTAIAVALHEIPQEIGDFGILLHAGLTRTRALFLNFISALFAFLGAIAVFLTSNSENLMPFILSLTAGGFIYIALADLIPELHKENAPAKSILQLITFLLGIAVMLSLTSLK